MGIKIFVGRWEDISRKLKLKGRTVCVVYSERPTAVVTVAETATPVSRGRTASQAAWLKKLVAFSNGRKSPKHTIDLDRDRIFEELHSDPH